MLFVIKLSPKSSGLFLAAVGVNRLKSMNGLKKCYLLSLTYFDLPVSLPVIKGLFR